MIFMNEKTVYPDCPTELSEEQLAAYWKDGYLALENALSPDEVAESCQELSNIFRSYAFNEEVAEYRPATSEKTNYSGANSSVSSNATARRTSIPVVVMAQS